MRREHFLLQSGGGSGSIEWPILETINSMYSGKPKYIHYPYDDSGYIIMDIPNGNSYTAQTHTFLALTPTSILASYTYSSYNERQTTPCYSVINGYFATAGYQKPWAAYIFHFDKANSTISFVRRVTTSYNWPMGDVYAYNKNGADFISLGKNNTRQTPGILQVSNGTYSASETLGRTHRYMLEHNYSDTSYPYVSIISYVDGGGDRIVKSTNNYGFGFASDYNQNLSNCVALSNQMNVNGMAAGYSINPIFGRDYHKVSGNNRGRYFFKNVNGTYYPAIISSDYSSLSLDTNHPLPITTSMAFFTSPNTFYYWYSGDDATCSWRFYTWDNAPI